MNGVSSDFVMQLVYPDCKPCSDVKIKCHLTFAHKKKDTQEMYFDPHRPFVSITIRE
jgi:hypothetical protein